VSGVLDLAGVVLAAGRGERLRPLTDLLPKPLCPIANRALVDLALDRVTPYAGVGPERLAVNTHYRADLVSDHLRGRVHLSDEQPEALGTAGALGRLRSWVDGRPVLLTNSDSYLPEGLSSLLEGWDGERVRLLCRETGGPSDFGTLRYVGACLLPWRTVAPLAATPSGLYEVLWCRELDAGALDLVTTGQGAIDCGRPADYLAANLDANGGVSVVGADAVVEGTIDRCVVWPGAFVGPDEHLVDTIRAGTRVEPVTVAA
jgi:MurNAc alpha-1-phosphate uridylyltransferase